MRDLTINGSYLTLASVQEEAHGIFVQGCEDVVIERVEVFQTAGDAVRLLGSPDQKVRRVWVQRCRLVQNKRTGVAFQRCVEFVWVRDCYIGNTVITGDTVAADTGQVMLLRAASSLA
jgi:hypothetical protein